MARKTTKRKRNNKMLPTPLAQRLYDFMEEHGLTQTKAREWADIAPSTLNKILRGGSVRAQTILQIAEKTGISHVTLLKDAGYIEEDAVIVNNASYPIQNPADSIRLIRQYFEVAAQLPANILNTPDMRKEIDAIQAAYQLLINKMKDS